MTRYIAFLRGINVGGYRPIKMNELRTMFSKLGFANATTYLQSGNVIFDAEDEAAPDFLAQKIQVQIEERFGYEVPVFIRTPSELKYLLDSFPFDDQEGWKGYITFLAAQPMDEQATELKSLSGNVEKFKFQETELFSFVNKKTDQKPQFSNSLVEKKLGVPATTRNLRTINKVLALTNVSN